MVFPPKILYIKRVKNNNDMTTATASRTFVHQSVNSSAISQLSVISSDIGGYELLVIFNSNPDKVYCYSFEDDNVAARWIDLLSGEESRNATSWGRELHRALKHGDLETVDVW
jgi:hypothetical protein